MYGATQTTCVVKWDARTLQVHVPKTDRAERAHLYCQHIVPQRPDLILRRGGACQPHRAGGQLQNAVPMRLYDAEAAVLCHLLGCGVSSGSRPPPSPSCRCTGWLLRVLLLG